MGNAEQGLRLLLARDAAEADAIAESLEEDNQRRRGFDEKVLAEASLLVETQTVARVQLDPAGVGPLASGRDRHRRLAAGRALPAPHVVDRLRRRQRTRPRLGAQRERARSQPGPR